MTALIHSVRSEGDSVGGVIECIIRGVPAGLGEPVFDKLEADLAKQVTDGLQRLYARQHVDGGWGWWSSDESDSFMTAYALFGLVKAQQSGFAVDAGVMSNATPPGRISPRPYRFPESVISRFRHSPRMRPKYAAAGWYATSPARRPATCWRTRSPRRWAPISGWGSPPTRSRGLRR